MFSGFFVTILLLHFYANTTTLSDGVALFVGSLLMLVVGLFDDRGLVSVRSRFSAEAVAAIIMIIWGGVVLNSLGGMFLLGVATLGLLAAPITIIAVIGGINAMNMSDGVDGLAGGLALVTLVSMAYLAWYAGYDAKVNTLLILVGVVAAFLVTNMRTRWRQRAAVFMGDSGSMFLGFILIWYMTSLSQGEQRAMTPVVALWIFAVPLFDMFHAMFRRIMAGRSPLQPDREHLHHMLQTYGLSVERSVFSIILASALMAVIGITGYLNAIPEWIMFYSYLILFIIYVIVVETVTRSFKRGDKRKHNVQEIVSREP